MSSPIERLAKFAKLDDLSCAQVAEIIGVTKEVVYDLVHQGQLECLAVRGNGRRRSEHRLHLNHRFTYHITPRQTLAYIIRATRGSRETVMAEVELLLPKMLPFAQLIARKTDDAAKPQAPTLPLVFGGAVPRKAPAVKEAAPSHHLEMFSLDTLKRTA